MIRPGRVAALLLGCSLAAGGCFQDVPAAVPDADPAIDPARGSPTDPVPTCTDTCENHLGTLCTMATDHSLCTCAVRGNSGRGKWDCLTGGIAGAPACDSAAAHGTACSTALTTIDQVCASSAPRQVCFCSSLSLWRCGLLAD
jgi:hypothetical protein